MVATAFSLKESLTSSGVKWRTPQTTPTTRAITNKFLNICLIIAENGRPQLAAREWKVFSAADMRQAGDKFGFNFFGDFIFKRIQKTGDQGNRGYDGYNKKKVF